MKTRDKIVQTAKSLFNERGFANVSLATLAEELGIAKGNVWYHFNDKRALLAAINAEYTAVSEKRLKMVPDPENILQSYAAFIQTIAWEIREFRFMFRDRADYGQHSEKFEENLPAIYEMNFAQFAAYFQAMIDSGFLRVAPKDIEDLVYNAVIVLRYNLEFEKEIGRSKSHGAGGVRRSLLQHLSVLKLYMEPMAYAVLKDGFEAEMEEEMKWAI